MPELVPMPWRQRTRILLGCVETGLDWDLGLSGLQGLGSVDRRRPVICPDCEEVECDAELNCLMPKARTVVLYSSPLARRFPAVTAVV